MFGTDFLQHKFVFQYIFIRSEKKGTLIILMTKTPRSHNLSVSHRWEGVRQTKPGTHRGRCYRQSEQTSRAVWHSSWLSQEHYHPLPLVHALSPKPYPPNHSRAWFQMRGWVVCRATSQPLLDHGETKNRKKKNHVSNNGVIIMLGYRYGLNCVPTRFICWSPNSQATIWR